MTRARWRVRGGRKQVGSSVQGLTPRAWKPGIFFWMSAPSPKGEETDDCLRQRRVFDFGEPHGKVGPKGNGNNGAGLGNAANLLATCAAFPTPCLRARLHFPEAVAARTSLPRGLAPSPSARWGRCGDVPLRRPVEVSAAPGPLASCLSDEETWRRRRRLRLGLESAERDGRQRRRRLGADGEAVRGQGTFCCSCGRAS